MVFLDVSFLCLRGIVTDHVSSNLPLGAIALLVVPCLFRSQSMENAPLKALPFSERLYRIDWLGTGLFLSSFICLFLALQWGGQTKSWSSATVIGLFIVFVLLLGGFAMTQRYMGEASLIPLRFITQRTILSGTIYLVLLGLQMAIVGHSFCLHKASSYLLLP